MQGRLETATANARCTNDAMKDDMRDFRNSMSSDSYVSGKSSASKKGAMKKADYDGDQQERIKNIQKDTENAIKPMDDRNQEVEEKFEKYFGYLH